MFELEALKARHGDCLLLHWGTVETPRLALVDGGPDGTYASVLRRRLGCLAKARRLDRIPIDIAIVSHIDDDHIAGIVDMAEEIENGAAPASIDLLWHNSLEGLLDQPLGTPRAEAALASIQRTFPQMDEPWAQKVLASVGQGRAIHGFAKRTGLLDTMNHPHDPLVLAGPGAEVADIEGLRLTAVCPGKVELEALRTKWAQLSERDATAAYKDRSPYNLSSIVLLAEYGGKRMLLTGDGRGDLILQGLEDLGLLTDGRIHVDLLKVPHHGSCNNVKREFFERVTADTYVVSGDHGRFPNPSAAAMTWLRDARAGSKYEVCCTYDLPYMREIFGDAFRVPPANAASVKATLVA